MNIKTITLVVLLSGLVGTMIYFGSLTLGKQLHPAKESSQNTTATPKPTHSPTQKPKADPDETPKPTDSPINGSTNLNEEIKKLSPRDFSADYESLKKEAAN